MELASLSPVGRIVLTLGHGKHAYSELKLETGLSDRWLTIKLKELEDGGVVKKDGKWYGLSGELPVSPYELNLYLRFQARRVASELARLRHVQAIILFGGVARGSAHEHSDLDMIIVADGQLEKVKEQILSKILELELNYHLTIEPLILCEEDFLDNVHSQEGGIIYGVAEGFEVLVDKTGILTRALQERIEDIRGTHEYLKEARIWLKLR